MWIPYPTSMIAHRNSNIPNLMHLHCRPPQMPANQFCMDGRYGIWRGLIVRSIVSQSFLPRNSLIEGSRRPSNRPGRRRRCSRKMWSRMKRHRGFLLLELQHHAWITRRRKSLVSLRQSVGHGRGGDNNMWRHGKNRLWDPGCLGSWWHPSLLGEPQELQPYLSIHIGLIRRFMGAKLPPRNSHHRPQYLLRPWGIIPEIQHSRRGLRCKPCFLYYPDLLLILTEFPWGKFCPTVDTQRSTMLTCPAGIRIIALPSKPISMGK